MEALPVRTSPIEEMRFHGRLEQAQRLVYDNSMASVTDHPIELAPDLEAKRTRLLQILGGMDSAAIALSGGVDSSVVAMAGRLALGERAVAITADSPSVARADLETARKLAKQIGIRHVVVATGEFQDPDYVRNDGTRCYYFKSELYDRIESMLPILGASTICSGANLDDQDDYRPGLKAAAEHKVRHPLAEAGCSKADVRAIARSWGLPVWDKPASPCLSSRVAAGVEVTKDRIARIEGAEAFLKQQGLTDCRVRLHEGELARIEVPDREIARVADPGFRQALSQHLRELGFLFVTIDVDGLRSGSLNVLVDVEMRSRFASDRGIQESQA
jgi:uncharacterized protein